MALNTSLSQSITLDIPGGEYSLATFQENDIESLQETLSIDSIGDRLILTPKPYTLSDAEFWVSLQMESAKKLLPLTTIAERNSAFFSQENSIPLKCIRYKGKLIGSITLTPCTPLTNRIVELGYYLHPDHHGKRIMNAAGKKLLQYAANEFGIRTVYSSADITNPMSAKVIQSLARQSKDEVIVGYIVLHWPEHKRIEGREVESPSTTWQWTIEPEKGYEYE